MAFENLQDLIYFLDRNKLLAHVIKELDPYLEISEVSDRVVKQGGPALLFEKPHREPFSCLDQRIWFLRAS